MIASKILPALAVFGVAAAQTASICSQATATINSQADASQYALCKTITGNVVIGVNADPTIALEGVTTIDGDLIAKDVGNLATFGSTTLTKVTGSFTLYNLTLLTTLSMGSLVEVKGISWSSLPRLSVLTFGKEIKKAETVLITNTFLRSLDGINLDTVDEFDINNNNRLTELETQVANITRSLNIDANGQGTDQGLKVTFPNLVRAGNMTFRNASSVSIPSLSKVDGSIGFYGNYFDELLAPNLTTVGSSLAFVANGDLKNLTLPLLTSIGGANLIANNSGLGAISFPALKSVGGAIDFSGNFSSPSIPKLEDVKGGFNMQSTEPIDCAPYKALAGKTIQGTFTCITTKDAKGGVGSGSGTGTSSGASPSESKKGAASSFGVSFAVAGLSVVGVVFGMML